MFVCLLIVLGWYPLCHRKSLEPCTYRKGPVGCQRLSLQPAGTCRAAFLASLTEGQYLLPPPFGRTYLASKSRARPYQVLKATDDGHAHHQVHRYPACHASGSWGRIHSPTVFSSFWAHPKEVSVKEVEGIKSFASYAIMHVWVVWQ